MADAKITDLTELTSVAVGDMVPIVDDPGGTPVTKKATVANLMSAAVAGVTPASIGAQPVDAKLTAIAGLTGALDRMIYFTGPSTAAVTGLTAAARSILDDPTTVAILATLSAATLTPTASQEIVAQGATVIPVIIKGAAGQTAALFSVIDSTGLINFLSVGPTGQVVISRVTAANAALISAVYTNDAVGVIIQGRKSRSTTVGGVTIVQSGDQVAVFQGSATDGAAAQEAASFRVYVDGTPGASDMPGRASVWTTPDGSATPVERTRIDNAGALDHRFGLRLSNVISPAQIAANTDNYAPAGLAAATCLRLSTDASRNLTGMTAGTDGDMKLIQNVGAFDLVLINDATSTAANRFLTTAGGVILVPNASVWVRYDGTSSRWRVIAL